MSASEHAIVPHISHINLSSFFGAMSPTSGQFVSMETSEAST